MLSSKVNQDDRIVVVCACVVLNISWPALLCPVLKAVRKGKSQGQAVCKGQPQAGQVQDRWADCHFQFFPTECADTRINYPGNSAEPCYLSGFAIYAYYESVRVMHTGLVNPMTHVCLCLPSKWLWRLQVQ